MGVVGIDFGEDDCVLVGWIGDLVECGVDECVVCGLVGGEVGGELGEWGEWCESGYGGLGVKMLDKCGVE